MEILLQVLRLLAAVVIAWIIGKLVSKLRLPAILGWLITGMFFGPYAIGLISQPLLNSAWFTAVEHLFECTIGLMIGNELVWRKIKSSGKSILVTTLTQSLGTFLVVSLVFAIIFHFAGVPIYLAFIFGGIALATAPLPALSIVQEFHTKGPVTSALLPMAALDDIVGCVVFFTVISVVTGKVAGDAIPTYEVVLVIFMPLIIGILCGLLSGLLFRKPHKDRAVRALVLVCVLATSVVGWLFNKFLLPDLGINYMLMGMAWSATVANMISSETLEQINRVMNPILGVMMIVVILNLGAPLDYHLILGAGLYTAVYILSRAFGKYFGAHFGARITKAPATVRKYLGLTLLPHSGVSLVFTGIAVSLLMKPAPQCAKILQGTIAAAAIINEIIAVILSKKSFEWAGELGAADRKKENVS